MLSKHQNINFTVEQEIYVSLSFLDVKICLKYGKFVTSIFRKPIFSGVFTNYEILIPTYQKRGRSHKLLHRNFSICCDFETFPFEIDHLKKTIKTYYLLNFIDSCIESFLHNLYRPKVIASNVPKINLFVKMPFLGSTSFQIRKKFQKLFIDALTFCNLKDVFTSPVRVKSFFLFKDKLLKVFPSGCVYKYKCGGCNATCYGKTQRHFKVQICEQLGISHLTGRKVKIANTKNTSYVVTTLHPLKTFPF